jgi:hypothetical protein
LEISTALGILRRLSNGVDPITGEIYPTGSPYQQPDVIRALITAVNALEKIEEKTVKRVNLPENAGKPWSDEEQKLLIERFDKGANINDLSKEHGRTRGSITSRLVKLGKINPIELNQFASITNRQNI